MHARQSIVITVIGLVNSLPRVSPARPSNGTKRGYSPSDVAVAVPWLQTVTYAYVPEVGQLSLKPRAAHPTLERGGELTFAGRDGEF